MLTDRYVIKDLREPFFDFPRYDLCLCLEVAEHIEPEYAEIFVRNLTRLSNDILISIAPPGQGGHHHVNCRDIEYWDGLFNAVGLTRLDNISDKVKSEIEPWKDKPGIKAYWYNLHFYRRL
jgi:hypothetical protein